MPKRRILFLLVLSMMLVLAACGGKKTENGKEDNASKSTGENPADKRGNSLVVAIPTDPQSWDPIDTFLLDWSSVASSIYEGLVDRNLDLELEPGLAESWEFKDDLTLEFKLREGVEFHNGEPFNANAVKFTFDRLLGEEGAKGPQQSNYTSIDSVEIVSDYEVVFHLNQPDPVLLTKLAGYGAMIVPPEYVQENSEEFFNDNPVGTGPFKFSEYKRDQFISLEKNENYWKEDLPKLDEVTFRFIPEASTRLAELQTGTIDIMKRVEISQANSVKDSAHISLEEVGSPTVFSLRFDVGHDIVDNQLVRQALNYAVDKEAIIDEILDGYGAMISTYQSDLSFGNNEELVPYAYDPEKAKELLAEAGVAEGTELELYIPGNDGTFKEIAQIISFYFEEVGINLNINSADPTTMNSDLIPQGKAGHLFRQGWGGWTLDFDNTAYLMYGEGEFWNPSFKDDKVQELLEAERSTVDQNKRAEIFKELTEVLYEIAPEINLYQEVALYGVNDRVVEFQPPHEDRIRLENVSVK